MSAKTLHEHYLHGYNTAKALDHNASLAVMPMGAAECVAFVEGRMDALDGKKPRKSSK